MGHSIPKDRHFRPRFAGLSGIQFKRDKHSFVEPLTSGLHPPSDSIHIDNELDTLSRLIRISTLSRSVVKSASHSVAFSRPEQIQPLLRLTFRFGHFGNAHFFREFVASTTKNPLPSRSSAATMNHFSA
jgi:hypothetical protein